MTTTGIYNVYSPCPHLLAVFILGVTKMILSINFAPC